MVGAIDSIARGRFGEPPLPRDFAGKPIDPIVIPSEAEESLTVVWPLFRSEIFRDVSTLLDMTGK
jgi:hypothetical protein